MQIPVITFDVVVAVKLCCTKIKLDTFDIPLRGAKLAFFFFFLQIIILTRFVDIWRASICICVHFRPILLYLELILKGKLQVVQFL